METTGCLQIQEKKQLSRHNSIFLGCGVAQIEARRLAVRQARVRISARHPREGPLPNGGQQEWCSTSSIYKIVYVYSIYVPACHQTFFKQKKESEKKLYFLVPPF